MSNKNEKYSLYLQEATNLLQHRKENKNLPEYLLASKMDDELYDLIKNSNGKLSQEFLEKAEANQKNVLKIADNKTGFKSII